jgi:deoxyribodipyrimidine photo-lyase
MLNVFWFRRDLRIEDNVALFHALQQEESVLPIFIFDKTIIEHLPKNDARVQFIYALLSRINQKLAA